MPCFPTRAAVLLCLLAAVGCASTPNYRPPVDLPGGGFAEGGVAVDTAANLSAVAPGAVAWGMFRTEPGFDFFAAGRTSPAFDLTDGSFQGILFGGSAGVRYRVQQSFLEDMCFAGEVYGDYLQLDYAFLNEASTPATQRYLSGVVRLPVAQRVVDRVWLYTAPTVGLSVPLFDDPLGRPFFGISELPLGIVWTPLDWLSIVAEGGYHITLNGGYGGVAVMFHM